MKATDTPALNAAPEAARAARSGEPAVYSGPSAEAPWQQRLPVLAGSPGWQLLPDAADSDVTWCLPDRLAVARGAEGYPILSLTLLLDRQPDPGLAAIGSHLLQATLALELSLPTGLPPLAHADEQVRMIFARSMHVELCGAGGEVLAAGEAGAGGHATLSATLGKEQALAVIDALDGAGGGLSLHATLSFRAISASSCLRLTGRWCDVHDALSALPAHGEGTAVNQDDLSAAYAQLLRSGTLALTTEQGDPGMPAGGEGLFRSFTVAARAMLLDGEGRLGPRPAPVFRLDLTYRGGGPVERSLTLSCPLEQVLGGVLDGLQRERAIRLVALSAGVGAQEAVAPVPRRVRMREAPLRRGAGAVRLGRLPGGKLASASLLLSNEGSAVNPHRLLTHLDLAALRVNPKPSGPVIDDANGWVFADGADDGFVWVQPSFELLMPDPAGDAAAGPFKFSFVRSGATASGDPGIDATVRFRLRQLIGPEAQALLAARGNPATRLIDTADAAVELDLPFRDAAGVTRSQRFGAEVKRHGDLLDVTVTLLDAWARLCYGALSLPGF